MTPNPPDRAALIFAAALDLPQVEREAHIAKACGEDTTLITEVQNLLAAHEETPTCFMSAPAADNFSDFDLAATIDAAGSGETSGKPVIPFPVSHGSGNQAAVVNDSNETAGEMIGRYKLLQEIGEGGFGTVWMAEQTEPVTRRVALKIIKQGMDTREVITRFEAERQALAMMDDPNIAKVFDAGATDKGRPFFVMELVKGIPITDFCDEAGLGTRERLALFADVCSAINHAHQKGIIHRDIKPSNVMVTLHGDKPVVKVIDFGIAKATQGKLTDQTLFTRFEQFLGTPVYMSPEQAALSGLDIDTRSDIYALGILLYELLVGRPPFDAKTLLSAGYDEMRRIIREVEPVKPSSCLGTIVGKERTELARSRHIEPEKLSKTVQPDLDWIVMKAIDKDRSRRYETANGLALDINRFLADEPVSATPPSVGYRFGKFARRHRAAIQVAASIVLLLLGASIVSTCLAVQASRARAAAQAESVRAREAEQREAQLRLTAETEETIARRRAYAADLTLCQQALAVNNLREARQLLDQQRPTDGEEDLRNWEWRRLWESCQSDALFELGEHENRVLKAVYVDDGKTVVTYQDGGLVRRWNMDSREGATLQEGRKKTGLMSNSGYMSVSDNGRWIAAVGMNGDGGYYIRIWDFSSSSAPRIISLGKEKATAVAISPDGGTLAAFMAKQNVALLWDIESGKERQERVELKPSESQLRFSGAIRFSPDGNTLAVGGNGGEVRLMNTENWTPKADFAISQTVSALEFSPNGRFLACGGKFVYPRIVVWDVEKGEIAQVLSGHAGFIADLGFSPDSNLLASASGDQTVKIWNTGTWEERTTLLGHTDEVWSVAFSPKGQKLISGGKDRRVEVWSAVDLPERDGSTLPLTSEISSLDASPDGSKFVMTTGGSVKLVGDAIPAVPEGLGRNNEVAFWVARNEIVICSKAPFEIKVWNLDSKQMESFPLTLESDPDKVAFRYLPVSRILVVLAPHEDARNTIVIRWGVETRSKLSTCVLPIDDSRVKTGSVSQNGSRLAVHGWDSVDVYDIISGEQQTSIQVSTKTGIKGMALAPDGKQLAVAETGNPKILLWDVETRVLQKSVQGHNLVILKLAYSPDGTRLLSSTIGSEPIKLWDTRIWKEVSRFEAHPGHFLFKPAFLSDGSTIAALQAGFDSGGIMEVRHWSAPSQQAINEAEIKGIWK